VTQFTTLFDSSHRFNKKDNSKDVNARKPCTFAIHKLIIHDHSRHFNVFFFFLYRLNTLCRGRFVSDSERRTPESLRCLCTVFLWQMGFL